jgi:MFS family permease
VPAQSFLDREHTVAPHGHSRWLIPRQDQGDGDHGERLGQQRGQHPAVLAAVDGPAVQRHRGHRDSRASRAAIKDFFRNGATSTVTVAAAAGFVGLLSVANMASRIGWSSTSDAIGRKPTYMMYLGGCMLLALAGAMSTALFVVLCALIISFYGGGFATVPSYLRDLFGMYQVGAIHGRLLTAWSTAGILGPLIVNRILDAQGKPGELAAEYRPALFTMVDVLLIGFIANLLIRPVSERWHEKTPAVDAVEAAHRPAEDIPVVDEQQFASGSEPRDLPHYASSRRSTQPN